MSTTAISVEACSDGTPLVSCPLCCEEKTLSELCSLSKCSHESCRDCIQKWIEKAEASGQTKLPGCPFCRVEMTSDETACILGRPFQPATATAATVDIEELDDLTRQWLQEQTKACPSCGAYIEKLQDTCEMMECLCGYRFCYNCGAQGATCACTPSYHRFWDNVLDRQAEITAPPSARMDEATGVVDLRQHMANRKQEEHAKQVREERMERRESEAHERLEEVNLSAVWLFCGKREASLKVLRQVLRGQSVRWIRGRKERELRKEEQVQVGKWLYSTKDNGSKVIASLYSSKAIKKRARRAKAKANNDRELAGVDAAFSSGKWLYYRRDNAGTMSQIAKFSRDQKNETAVHFDRWFLRDDYWCGCGDSDCEDCQDSEQEAKENAVRIRVFFLNEETKAKEMDEINQHGLELLV